MHKMKVGIGSYAFPWAIGTKGIVPPQPMDLWSFVDSAAKLHAECVHIGDNLDLRDMSITDLSRLRDQCRERQVVVLPGIRGLQPARVGDYLRMAQFLECDQMHVTLESNDYQPNPQEVITTIREHLPALRSLGIRMVIQHTDYFFTRIYRNIVEQTDPSWVGIGWNAVNALSKGEGFMEVSRQLLPYTYAMYLKDYVVEKSASDLGVRVVGTPAGKGILPIPWLVKRLRDTGKCKYLILELWTPAGDSVEATIRKEYQWVKDSMEYMQVLSRKLLHRG